MDKALVVKGIDRWQLGYFVAKFEELYRFDKKKYEIESVTDSNELVIKIKKLSFIDELRVLKACRKTGIEYYLGTFRA